MKRRLRTVVVVVGVLAIVFCKWTLVSHFVTNTRWSRTFYAVR